MTRHVEAAVGHGSAAELDEESDAVLVTERMQRDKALVSRTVNLMLRTLDKVLAGDIRCIPMFFVFTYVCPLQADLSDILNRMDACGMNPRTRKRVQHKVLSRHKSSEITQPSAAKSRKASLAILGKLPPDFLPAKKKKSFASLPTIADVDSIGTQEKVTKEGVHRPAPSSGGSKPKYLTPFDSPSPKAKATGVTLSKSGCKINRSGTHMSVEDHEIHSASSHTTSGLAPPADSVDLVDDQRSHMAAPKGGGANSLLLSNITNAIQKIVLWSHPT